MITRLSYIIKLYIIKLMPCREILNSAGKHAGQHKQLRVTSNGKIIKIVDLGTKLPAISSPPVSSPSPPIDNLNKKTESGD